MENNINQEKHQPDYGSRNQKKKSLLDFFKLGEVGAYFFRSKDSGRPSNINIKLMHGINKFSIIFFLAGMLYFIFKKLL